jgi:hypothetical protein|tara:strand:+ start:272 stop:1255 length:984 start_codon:yes stop_codon:yes gene_type:complete
MKVDKSVQGAADKLLGLLNPQEGQSEPKKDQPAPQEQTEPVKTEPVAEEVSKSKTEEAKPEAESSETQTETEQTEEQEIQKPSLHRVKVQGQELEVSLDELKSGYSRDSDYRQKTHALAEERRMLDEQKTSLSQSYDGKLKELTDLIGAAESYIGQSSKEDLQKMYEEDPTQAAKIDFQQRQQRESFNKLKQQAEVVKLQQYNQYLDEQKRLAATKIPEYSDPVKGVTFKNQMKNTLSEYGFNDQEIGSLADHRFLMVLRDAMEYKNLKSKPVTNKKVTTAPKVVKSGTPKMEDSRRAAVKQKIGRLRRSGKINDAQSAILEIIGKK